jgi:hypothetical protein
MTPKVPSAQADDQAQRELASQLYDTVAAWSARQAEAPALSLTLGAVCFFTGYTLAQAYASADEDGSLMMAWEHYERTVAGLVASALACARVPWHLDHRQAKDGGP